MPAVFFPNIFLRQREICLSFPFACFSSSSFTFNSTYTHYNYAMIVLLQLLESFNFYTWLALAPSCRDGFETRTYYVCTYARET